MSMNVNKPRVIKDYEKLEAEIKEQIKYIYPLGFSDNLIYFTNKEGQRVSALPFETDEKYYLIRMTTLQADRIIEEDDDYDMDGNLKEEVREEYENKYADIDYIADYNTDDDDDDGDNYDDD